MPAPDTGKNIGRVSIKVLPDTKDFRERLERDLKRANDKGWAVKFDKADIDRDKIRKELEDKLNSLGMARVRVNVVPHVNSVKLNKNQVRRNIQEQLKDIPFAIDVHPQLKGVQAFKAQVHRLLSGTETVEVKVKAHDPKIKPELDRAALEKVRNELYSLFGDDKNGKRVINLATHLDEEAKLKLEHEVNALIRKYNGKPLGLNLSLNMLLARTRLMAFLRSRDLTIFVKISKASLAKAAKELATLATSATGLRLLGDWIDDLSNAFRNLDRNAPMIIGITSLVASAISAVMAAGQGIVGIAGDVAKIGPALLVLPGLILNAIASFVVIGIAMKDAKKELASLADDMTDLGRIISNTFWDQARDPIVKMTNTLLPQLRNALRDTAEATGGFVGKMAEAFEKHLGNGRLEKIFDGINESWDILASGADGFAGAIVNLSEIGARYMPGLAQWFTDLAEDFDAWLTKISTSDQLDTWINNAVFEMGELWRATKNAWGFLENLYEAANRAGGTGLTGLADMLGAWEEITSTKEFQDGLVAVFKGSSDAMDAFADAIKAIGRLISDNADSFEDLLASAGGFAGGLIEAIANALNSPKVIGGMNDFSAGLTKGLEKIIPQLKPLADTFGSFLSLLGTVAESTLPSVVEALGNLTPALDAIIKPIQDALPELGDALVQLTDAFGPSIEKLAGALSEAAISALLALADALLFVEPVFSYLIQGLADFLDGLAGFFGAGELDDLATNKPGWSGLKFGLTHPNGSIEALEIVADLDLIFRNIEVDPAVADSITKSLTEDVSPAELRKSATKLGNIFLTEYQSILESDGPAAASAFIDALEGATLPADAAKVIEGILGDAGIEIEFGKAGEASGEAFSDGVEKEGSRARQDGGRFFGPDYEALIEAWGDGGNQSAQAYWDALSSEAQDSIAKTGMLDALREQGILIEDEMGTTGYKAASAFGDNMDANIKPALAGAGATALTSLERAFSGVTLATGEKGLAAASALGQGLTSGTPGVQQAIAALKQAGLIDPMADLDSLMAVPGGDAILGLIAGLQSGTVGVQTATGGIRDAGIVDQFNMLSSVMPGVGADTIVGLIDGINSQSGALAGASGSVKQSGISDQFKAMSSLLPSAGADTILGLIQGLESKGITVGTTAESIKQSGILDKFVGADGFLTSEGKAIVDGLTSGINSGKTGVGTATDGVKQSGVIDKFNGAGNLLLGPGGDIIKGLTTGITGQKSATSTATEGVRKSGILDWFNNPSSMLSTQGSSITSGLANAINQAKYLVAAASRDVRKDGVVSPFDGVATQMNGIGTTIPANLAQAMRGGSRGVSDAAGSLRTGSIFNPFIGVDRDATNVGSSIPNSLAQGIWNSSGTVSDAASSLRTGSVLDRFSGMDQNLSSLGLSTGFQLAAGLYASAGTVRGAAQYLRTESIMSRFSGLNASAYTIGLNTGLQLSWGLHASGNAVGNASASLANLAASNLSRLTGSANAIGANVYSTISYWVNLSIGQLDRLSSAARTAQANAALASSSLSAASAPTSVMSLNTIASGVAAQSSLMTTNAAASTSYTPTPLSSETVLGKTAQTPSVVNVTMPLLPGETPAEQRTNVVRELRNASGN